MNKTLWNRNKVTKKQLALITSLNLWRKRGSNVNNMVVGVLSGHFQSFKSGIWTSLRNATHLSQHHSHDPPDSWSLGFGQWVMGIPECTWMKDAMLHVLVTSCGTGRIGPLLSSTHGRTYRGISLSIKMQKKKVFCLQPFMKQLPLARSNSYYASWFTEIIVLLLGQYILLAVKIGGIGGGTTVTT